MAGNWGRPMLKTIRTFLKGSLTMKYEKGIMTAVSAVLVFGLCMAISWAAQKYLTKQEAQEVEDVVEDIAEYEVEHVLSLPEGSTKKEMDALFSHEI